MVRIRKTQRRANVHDWIVGKRKRSSVLYQKKKNEYASCPKQSSYEIYEKRKTTMYVHYSNEQSIRSRVDFATRIQVPSISHRGF